MISLISILMVALCAVIYYLILYYRRRKSLIQANNTFHEPVTIPLSKYAHYLILGSKEFLDIIYQVAVMYPSLSRGWLANKLYIILSDPEHAKVVLNSHTCLEKSDMYQVTDFMFGAGILTAPVSTWSPHRKLLAKCFNTITLNSFFNTFVGHSLIFIDDLEQFSLNGEKVDIKHHIEKCTMDIICDNAMGIKSQSQSHKNVVFMDAINRGRKIIRKRVQNIFLHYDVIYNLTPLAREQRKIADVIRSFSNEIIQHKACINEQKKIKADDEKTDTRKILDVLMKEITDKSDDPKKYTLKSLNDEIITIFLTGSDTSANIINFVIFMLANFPKIQEKVYQELSIIYGKEDPKSTRIRYEDLERLDYLDRVIKETMRLFPIGPAIARYLTEDLKIGEYTLPKGADIILVILKIHRDERYWPKPLVFDPDRFLPENVAKRHPYSYIPFSAGPRNCIGMKYGMLSVKVILATLVRTYIFEVDESIEINQIKFYMDVTINPVEPLKVKLRRRNVEKMK